MSTHKKDSSVDDPLAAESKEMALEEPAKPLLEKIPSKKNFNTDYNGPESMPDVEPILESKNMNVSVKGSPNGTDDQGSHPKKSKDTTNTHQKSLSNQDHEPKSSSTSFKEPEADNQWVFLDTVPDFMKCKICSSVFESPQLLSCCGTNICKKCMDRHLQRLATLADQKPSCTFCRSTDFKLINNTALEQTINQLKVQCCYQCKGCGWIDTLENGKLHLRECEFAPIDCPNGCGCGQFERYRLSDHMLICPHTRIACSFETIGCDTKKTFLRQEAQKHANACLSQHLLLIAQKNTRLLKDYQKVYTSLQSESRVDVNDEQIESQREALASNKHTINSLKESLKETQQQTATLKTELRRGEICLEALKKSVSETKNTEATYKESLAQIQTMQLPQAVGISCIPVTFTIDNFNEKINRNERWLSPPFYTHAGGYKMCLSVCPDCNKPMGYGRSISVNIHFLAGEFDDHLTWPFPGAIFTITAIDQRANKCNRSINLELVGEDTLRIRSKRTDGSLSVGFGAPDILFSSDYLSKDNSFKLMVYRVQFFPL